MDLQYDIKLSDQICELYPDREIILSTDNARKELYYLSNEAVTVDRSKQLFSFFSSLRYMHSSSPGLLSLDAQMSLHNFDRPGECFFPPRVWAFHRQNSGGETIRCSLVMDGNHRIAMAKLFGIAIEVVADRDLGDIGSVRNRFQVRNALREYLYPTAHIWHHGQFESALAQYIT